jgi:hypothetical protein
MRRRGLRFDFPHCVSNLAPRLGRYPLAIFIETGGALFCDADGVPSVHIDELACSAHYLGFHD